MMEETFDYEIGTNLHEIEVTVEGIPLAVIMLQNDPAAGGCGVAVVRFEDCAITDLRDLLGFATESLTRLLDGEVEIQLDTQGEFGDKKEDAPE
jgi:hypothetical protein